MMRLGPYVELARPAHWVKNVFVLAGLLFGHAWRDPVLLGAALLAAVAFCLAASGVYALNDSIDADRDREHPDKRDRPVARGAVSVGAARWMGAVLVALALGLGALAATRVAVLLLAYLVLNIAYSLVLKRVPVVDVFVIAAGFMLRLLAGTLGIGIAPSNWLFACGFLLTLFLGFAKRRAELVRLNEEAGRHRAVLDAYSLEFLDGAVRLCAAGAVLGYALYTLSPETAALHGTRWLVLTLPWALLGTLRYLFRLHYRGGGGDPALEVLRDPVLVAASIGWLATVVALFAAAAS